MSKYDHIDEAALDRIDRLGLAYCRLNSGEWDEIIGPKPEGFDEMPDFDEDFHRTRRRTIWPTKHDYIGTRLKGITDIIGDANASRCWWMYAMNESEQAWREWYTGDRLTENGFDGYGYLKKPEPFLKESTEKSTDQGRNEDLKPGANGSTILALLFKNLMILFLFFLLGSLFSFFIRHVFKL